MKRLLLVDDHVAFRQSLALLIAPRLGCVDVQAGTFNEARRALADAEDGICLAVIDLDLPDGDTVELIGELRETAKEAAVLAFSNGRNPRALQAGADEVLTLRMPVRRFLDTATRLGKMARR